MKGLTRRIAPGAASPRLILTLLVGLIALAFAAPVYAQASTPSTDLQFPALTGRIVDQANLLTPAAEAALDAKLRQLETDTGDQLVVVTLTSLQGHEIEDYGYRLGRAWGIGQAGASSAGKNNGVLLIVAPAERKVRIEVGYGLEPILTDALSARIIQTDMLPAFREEGYTRGIDGGVDAIIAQLRLDPAEAQARAAAAQPEPSETPIGPIILVALVFLFMFLGSLRGAGRDGRRRGGGVGQVLTWAALNALSSSSSGSSGGGFGGGGGGFSGGGGSFGGGGASGGW